MNVKELGKYLFLDLGTLTPVLKKLEQKGYITCKRDDKDERVLNIAITKNGEDLKEQAVSIPEKMGSCVPLTPEDGMKLFDILHKMLGYFNEDNFPVLH